MSNKTFGSAEFRHGLLEPQVQYDLTGWFTRRQELARITVNYRSYIGQPSDIAESRLPLDTGLGSPVTTTTNILNFAGHNERKEKLRKKRTSTDKKE